MNKLLKSINELFSYLHINIMTLNNSKLFAGFVIILLNISSKFVTFKLSKSVESYLKFTFSKQILVFAMAWMGTRDIYISLFATLIFTILIEYLLNEESSLCCLPESFTDYHTSLLTNEKETTADDIKKAIEVLEKAKQQIKI